MGLSSRNLPCAVAAERLLSDDTYRDMHRTAEAEGFLDIADWFKTVARANRAHAERMAEELP
jgi:rubrerythrin